MIEAAILKMNIEKVCKKRDRLTNSLPANLLLTALSFPSSLLSSPCVISLKKYQDEYK